MITYEYRCDANDTTLTVRHSINEKLESWGELCSLADYCPGDTRRNTDHTPNGWGQTYAEVFRLWRLLR